MQTLYSAGLEDYKLGELYSKGNKKLLKMMEPDAKVCRGFASQSKGREFQFNSNAFI